MCVRSYKRCDADGVTATTGTKARSVNVPWGLCVARVISSASRLCERRLVAEHRSTQGVVGVVGVLQPTTSSRRGGLINPTGCIARSSQPKVTLAKKGELRAIWDRARGVRGLHSVWWCRSASRAQHRRCTCVWGAKSDHHAQQLFVRRGRKRRGATPTLKSPIMSIHASPKIKK